MEHYRLEPFAHLSSLSVNCTDDFFMTSGFCIDLGLYDLVSGRRLHMFRGLHQNFINILRFAHRSPHLFATASFDHTCKVWDLRQPVHSDRPAWFFGAETLNVMCCFSPDDRHVLCSGVDTALQQFSLDWRMDGSRQVLPPRADGPAGSRFPLPALDSDTNYRRSLYLADGSLIATAATNESILRLYTASAPHQHRGMIDFRHVLLARRQLKSRTHAAEAVGLQVGTALATPPRLPEPTDPGTPEASEGAESTDPEHEEYVQSLRCHPTDPSVLGALLSTCDAQPDSYIAMLRLGEDDCYGR